MLVFEEVEKVSGLGFFWITTFFFYICSLSGDVDELSTCFRTEGFSFLVLLIG